MILQAADNSVQSLKEELDSLLQAVQSNLEIYLEDPTQSVALNSVADGIGRIGDAFERAGQPQAASLAEEAVALARQMAQPDGPSQDNEQRLRVLLLTVLQVPQYLEWLRRGGKQPFDLLPFINQTRIARGLAPLTKSKTPSFLAIPQRQRQLPETVLGQLALRLRPLLQRALLGLLRGQTTDQLSLLVDLFSRFKEAAANETNHHFWWLAEGLLREIEQGNIPNDRDLQLLLRDLDAKVRYLVENGRMFSDEGDAEEFSQRLIDHLSRSDSGLRRLENRTDYQPPQTDQFLLSLDPSSCAVPPDMETLLRIGDVLRESLSLVKEAVDRFAQDHLHQANGLRGELNRLHEVANVLVMLNMDVPASLVRQHLKVLQQWLENGETVTDQQITELASELILVEDSLEGIGEFVCNHKLSAAINQNLDTACRIALLQDFQRRQARMAVIREATQVVKGARESAVISDGVTDITTRESLRSSLSSISGIFAVMDCPRAMGLAQQLADSIAGLPIERSLPRYDASTHALGEILDILEYYLEALSQVEELEDEILDEAERRIKLLAEITAASQVQVGSHEEMPDSELGFEVFDGLMEASVPEPVDTAEAMKLDELAEEFSVSVVPDSSSAGEEIHSESIPLPDSDSASIESLPVESGVDQELQEIFFEEAREELASIAECLAAWRHDLADREALTTIRRSFHTLKGSGRMVGQLTIGEFAWCLEDLLNHVLEGGLAGSELVLRAVEQAQSVLTSVLDSGGLANESDAAAISLLTQRVQALIQGGPWEEAAYLETSGVTQADEVEVSATDEEEPLPSLEIPEQNPEFLETVVEPIHESTSVSLPASGKPMGLEVDPELVEIFQYEAAEILDASDGLLESWRRDQNDEALNHLRREMHTLKGSSRMAGFPVIGDLAHAMESVLDALAADRIPAMPSVANLLQQALDRLTAMMAGVRTGAGLQPADDLITDIRNLLIDKPTEEAAAPLQPRVEVESGIPASEDAAVTTISIKPSPDVDPELVEAFLGEAAEILDASDVTLQGWRNDLDNVELLNNLRREMHTLKGGGRMAGFPAVGDLAHTMESVLDAIGKGSLKASTRVVDTLQGALDYLNDMLASVQGGSKVVPAIELINDLKDLLGEKSEETQPAVAPAVPAAKLVEKVPVAAVEDTIRVSAALLNNLINEMGESSTFRARIDQRVGALRFNLSELNQTVFRLRQQLRRLEIETEAQILFRYEEGTKDHQKEFDPLELDRFSEMQQLSRSLMESVDDLSNIEGVLEEQAQEMSFLLEQQGRVNKEVQQGLMQTRMVRFSGVVPRLRRVVRQAAQELGKRAELMLEGSESEVDRAVLDNMVAPLEHMLRNAISHGIEEPERRRAAGKPEAGTITLAMRREGAELVVHMSDDGAGLNFDAIRAKGEANGMLTPGKEATEEELIALLLRPGFSTASKVTQISGRGVGLDVLNDAIKSMRGTLLIQSQQGQGTRFTIRLPFSLAVTQALLVKVGSGSYAVPLLSIESVVRLSESELQDYLAGKTVDYKYGSYSYPLYNLGMLLGVHKASPGESVTDQRPTALLFRSAEASAALQVEAVLGNQEIIVKPVAPQFQAVAGVSGATVSADGRAVVVLDLAALVRQIGSKTRKQAEATGFADVRQQSRKNRLKALVIDDSITMRKVTSRFLERNGISATSAKDGVEAVAKLEELIPDLVVLDIEMPRMDGFEVAAHIRNQAQLKHVPIIMVTSRGGEKHRQRAAKLGVSAYLTKPYQEAEMLKTIREVLGEQAVDSLELSLARFEI